MDSQKHTPSVVVQLRTVNYLNVKSFPLWHCRMEIENNKIEGPSKNCQLFACISKVGVLEINCLLEIKAEARYWRINKVVQSSWTKCIEAFKIGTQTLLGPSPSHSELKLRIYTASTHREGSTACIQHGRLLPVHKPWTANWQILELLKRSATLSIEFYYHCLHNSHWIFVW